jgi:hypothetical protein
MKMAILLLAASLILAGCGSTVTTHKTLISQYANSTSSREITNNLTTFVNTTYNITTFVNTTQNITNNYVSNDGNNYTMNASFNNSGQDTTLVLWRNGISTPITATFTDQKGISTETDPIATSQIIALNATINGLSPGGNDWDVMDSFSRKYYYRTAFFESVTSGYNEPWIGTAITGGTSNLLDTISTEHPGKADLRSLAGPLNSGYSWQITNPGTYLLDTGYTTKASFRPITNPAGTNQTRIKFGFMDVFTVAPPIDGAYINITQNGTIFNGRGESRSNNAQSYTPTYFNLTNGTWYTAIVYIENTTTARFEIWNETTQLWTDKVYTNIPQGVGRATSNAFIALNLGNNTIARQLAHIDYLAVGINRTLIR